MKGHLLFGGATRLHVKVTVMASIITREINVQNVRTYDADLMQQ